MKRIIALGGEHHTGKSTLLCAALEDFFLRAKPFTYALLKGYVSYENRLVVLGSYAGSPTTGTDGLSKDVLADAVAFITNIATIFQHADQMTVVFEGSRLFNNLFLQTCRANCPDTRLLILKTNREILDGRKGERKLSLNEKRRTRSTVYKVGAILGARYLVSDNEADLEANRVALRKIIGLLS